jgi:(p)ppGpp synthase/HD superfamily hydrolase
MSKLQLSCRFEEALVYATHLHAGQARKGSDVPYVSHLLSVAALVMEDGGSEDEVIAALLHDAVEDQGGRETRREIARRFGELVARIVDGCTDTDETPKPPWRGRKESYVDEMRDAPSEVRRVSMADKLHNSRTILADLHRYGDAVWSRFKGGKDGTLWYYRALVESYRGNGDGYLFSELEKVVTEMEELASKNSRTRELKKSSGPNQDS